MLVRVQKCVCMCSMFTYTNVRAYMRAWVRACVHECMRVCVRACVMQCCYLLAYRYIPTLWVDNALNLDMHQCPTYTKPSKRML